MSTEQAKSVQLDGFGKYDCYPDGRIIERETGNAITPNKKGKVALTNDGGEAKVMNHKDIVAAVVGVLGEPDANGFELEPPAKTGEQEVVLTPEQEEQKRIDDEMSRLRKDFAAKSKALMTAKRDDLVTAHDEFEAAKKALEDFKAKHKTSTGGGGGRKKKDAEPETPPTPEQIAAQEAYDTAKAEFDVAKENLGKATEELKKYKKVGGGPGSGDHAPKMDYRTVQLVRKAYAVGRYPEYPGEKKSVADLCREFNISTSAIGYYVNYLQHKLRRKPADADMTQEENILLYTAWTPLVNDYYPAAWTSKDNVARSGAPYAEDNVKEDDSRYTKKTTSATAQA